MPDNIEEAVVLNECLEPSPTPEQEAEWDRERQAAWDALIQPYRDLRTQISEHDDLMADTLFEITMIELGMEG